jgi:RNA polymerase sigma-70 factor (ECF subfamily)
MILATNKVTSIAPRIAQGAKPLSDKDIDLALVQRVQRGDKSAFDLLVLKYQHKIGHLVTRYVHDVHESQDVTQEAFIKAYRGLKNFRGDSAFYTWLYRIAINTAKNHLVTRSRKISDTGIDAADAEQFESGGALRENASPDRVLATEEIARVVQDTINQLPEDLRTAITLREFDGLSYEEIALAMECPIGTVRSRIFRAREAIDTNLEPLLDEKRR